MVVLLRNKINIKINIKLKNIKNFIKFIYLFYDYFF